MDRSVSVAGSEREFLQTAEPAVVAVFECRGRNDAGISRNGDSGVLAGRVATDVGVRHERAADQSILLFPGGIFAGAAAAAAIAGRQTVFHYGFRNRETVSGAGAGESAAIVAAAGGRGRGICGEYDFWAGADCGKRGRYGSSPIFLPHRAAVLGPNRARNLAADRAAFLPEAEAAGEGVVVAAEARAGGESFQFFGIATAEDDVIGFERGLQKFSDFEDFAAPFFLAVFFQTSDAQVVLVGFSLFVFEMGEFHGFEIAVGNHGGAETGAETEEEHFAALVTAESLHGGIIDDFYGMAEGFGEVHTHPAATEIVRLAKRGAVDDGTGIAEGDAVEFPAFDGLLDVPNGQGGGHPGAGNELGGFLLAGHQELDVSATDIDDQDFGGVAGYGVLRSGIRHAFGRRRFGCHLLPPAGTDEGISAEAGSQTGKLVEPEMRNQDGC